MLISRRHLLKPILRQKMTLVSIGIQVGRILFRHRKQIYRVLVAQDRTIDRAFKIGGYGRQTRYGARHGALVGTVAGAFIGQDALPPMNGIPQKPKPEPYNQYKKRSGSFRYSGSKYQYSNRQPERRCRKPSTRFR